MLVYRNGFLSILTKMVGSWDAGWIEQVARSSQTFPRLRVTWLLHHHGTVFLVFHIGREPLRKYPFSKMTIFELPKFVAILNQCKFG